MTPVHVPTQVGDRGWPVLSAVRVATPDGGPAEFVVVVDRGEGDPGRRCATVRVSIWPDHVVQTEEGEHGLTFDEAQHSMLQRAGLLPVSRVEVVTVRDPDAANDYTIFLDGRHRDTGDTDRVTVTVVDIDAGHTGVTDKWVGDLLTRAGALSPAAAGWVRDVVVQYAEDHDIAVP